ncbi:hypothetical protein LBBP_03870 [Leptospira borgpetersenii serovar Ballum]|uniref:Uncharacterized protein n=1 Tax=Leptospira borgpetersenii serovar Ballum TaxID=280505 RepID=A0A0S2IWJ9_LEPBO|nr:hypothetical protein LBBP_03870 [Leptospira borgpetersenii serovar Ballum]
MKFPSFLRETSYFKTVLERSSTIFELLSYMIFPNFCDDEF